MRLRISVSVAHFFIYSKAFSYIRDYSRKHLLYCVYHRPGIFATNSKVVVVRHTILIKYLSQSVSHLDEWWKLLYK